MVIQYNEHDCSKCSYAGACFMQDLKGTDPPSDCPAEFLEALMERAQNQIALVSAEAGGLSPYGIFKLGALLVMSAVWAYYFLNPTEIPSAFLKAFEEDKNENNPKPTHE